MDYGIAIPSYINAWKDVQAAEKAGFTHAWFFDSQLIYSDVWATMALAAENTKKIKLKLNVLPAIRKHQVTNKSIIDLGLEKNRMEVNILKVYVKIVEVEQARLEQKN